MLLVGGNDRDRLLHQRGIDRALRQQHTFQGEDELAGVESAVARGMVRQLAMEPIVEDLAHQRVVHQLAFRTLRPWTPDVLLEGGETFELAGIRFEVLAVPGHSPAHLAYAIEGALLSGDVLFAGSVGRTDLPGADWATLLASLRSLFDRFPPETSVHPGHGPSTTLGGELAGNPFLAELRLEQREAAG